MSPNHNIAADSGGDNRIGDIPDNINISINIAGLAVLDAFTSLHKDVLLNNELVTLLLTCLNNESRVLTRLMEVLKNTAPQEHHDYIILDVIPSLKSSRDEVRAASHELFQVKLELKVAHNHNQQQQASSPPLQAADQSNSTPRPMKSVQHIASLARARAALHQHERYLFAAMLKIGTHVHPDPISINIVAALKEILQIYRMMMTSLKTTANLLIQTKSGFQLPIPSVVTIPPHQSSADSNLPHSLDDLTIEGFEDEEKKETEDTKLPALSSASSAVAAVQALPAAAPDIVSSPPPKKKERKSTRRRSKKLAANSSALTSVVDDPLINGISFANLTLDDTSDESENKEDGLMDRKLPAADGHTPMENSPPASSSTKKRAKNRGQSRGSQHTSSRSSSTNNDFAAGIDNDASVAIATQVFPPLLGNSTSASLFEAGREAAPAPLIHPSPPKATEKPIVLPIDEHKDEILRTVRNQRVTIIHGETGCGKSSRVPCMLLRAPLPDRTSTFREAKMMISQPRRIAAKALAERVRSCEPDLADKIGLRMGHGVREHETSKTRAWFVTTGYLVRVLANNPGWFDSHTHLIIDEVHERSIDTDILCLLCRRLLHSHPTIRLVLMSATMAAELYGQYFGVPQPPIFVGARRFPIKEYFVEDLTLLVLSSSNKSKSAKLVQDVCNECEKSKCKAAPTSTNMDKLYKLATEITASVSNHGSSVLIFVPGMSDIEAIIELIEKLMIPGITFLCLPIHSDVPFEDQLAVFEAPKDREVKVIIATNAAESSLTLPDCDHVICLGLCKQITYDSASHRQMLVPTWISRASATQRAGRTGRVREGNVYRLYSRKAFEQYMEPFEKGELVRSPLDTTILSLRDMLDEPVTPILLDCLEPPDISTIDRSFQSLHESNFITQPSDEGVITSMGSLVVALGIDLTLGNFVGLGIQFGVAAEAIHLAAILSFPQSPWAISNPLYHDVDTFNEIASKTFVSRCSFDAGLYSEPMAVLNLLHEYSLSKDRNKFNWLHCVSGTRIRHLYGTVQSLKQRVAEHLKIDSDFLDIESFPLNHSKVNILRVLQVWVFHDTIIVRPPSKPHIENSNWGMSINLVGPPIGRQHLSQILDERRHKFEILNKGQIYTQGSFRPALNEFSEKEFDLRFASYALEKKIDISSYFRQSTFRFFVLEDVWNNEEDELIDIDTPNMALMSIDEIVLQQSSGGNKRGIRGRACGAWQPSTAGSAGVTNDDTLQMKRVLILNFFLGDSKKRKALESVVEKSCLVRPPRSSLFCSITKTNIKTSFSVACKGECHGVSKTDLSDLFAAPDLAISTNGSIQQSLNFTCENNSDINDSCGNSLFDDAPEGARLMTVLASSRRKDNFIRFNDGKDDNEGSVDKFVDIVLPKNLSINGNKWKRKGGRGMVYVQENCVPAAALPTDHDLEIFGCCANTLELRGGACRVEGITLLPPGRMFLGLALLTFGVNPRTGSSHVLDFVMPNDEDEDEANEYAEEVVNAIVEDGLGWIQERDHFYDLNDQWRTIDALRFHSECSQLGETLECQPELIKNLCAIFDMVDGHPMTVWDIETVATLRTKSRAKERARNSSQVIPVASQQRQAATTQPTNRYVEGRPMVPSRLITSKKKRQPAVVANATKNRKNNNN